MSHSQFRSKKLILRHAWLNLWDKHMTTGRINQVTTFARKSSDDEHNLLKQHALWFDPTESRGTATQAFVTQQTQTQEQWITSCFDPVSTRESQGLDQVLTRESLGFEPTSSQDTSAATQSSFTQRVPTRNSILPVLWCFCMLHTLMILSLK